MIHIKQANSSSSNKTHGYESGCMMALRLPYYVIGFMPRDLVLDDGLQNLTLLRLYY